MRKFILSLIIILSSFAFSFAAVGDNATSGSGIESDPYYYSSVADFVSDFNYFAEGVYKPTEISSPYVSRAVTELGITGNYLLRCDYINITFYFPVSIDNKLLTYSSRTTCQYDTSTDSFKNINTDSGGGYSFGNTRPFFGVSTVPTMVINNVYVTGTSPEPPAPPIYYNNPNYPLGNPYYPTVPTGWDNFSEMIAGLLYDNFKFTCNDQTYNSNWMPVGEYLMYDFLCKNNPTLETVSFNDYTYTNYMYSLISALGSMESMSDNIQLLADVYASPEEVEAREFAAENQQAVVDNFIDPDGSGAASASDFETISDLSDGFKNTFSSDADPAGIFDLFNSTNLGWFSQETLNQLDTSNNNRKSVSHVDTPLLDQQIEEIYSRLGVKYAH